MFLTKHSFPTASTTASFSTSSTDDNHWSDGPIEKTPSPAKADIYGQVYPIESSQLLEQRLEEFDTALGDFIRQGKSNKKNSTALHDAMTKNPSLYREKSFRLMFLRAECFRVKDAVRRFVKYWDIRLELFGREKGFQSITMETLDDDSRGFLKRGIVRWIRRPSDRDIIFFDPSRLDPKSYKRISAVQATWYILHTILEHDVRIQRMGVICLAYPRNFSSTNRDPALTKQCLKIIQHALPIRITACHCSSIPIMYYWLMQLILCFVDDHVRKCLIVHGDIDDDQVAVRLESLYGIEPEAIPRELGGKIDLESLPHEWCINYSSLVEHDGKVKLTTIMTKTKAPKQDFVIRAPKQRGFKLLRQHCI